jgi:hypothetical protein
VVRGACRLTPSLTAVDRPHSDSSLDGAASRAVTRETLAFVVRREGRSQYNTTRDVHVRGSPQPLQAGTRLGKCLRFHAARTVATIHLFDTSGCIVN